MYRVVHLLQLPLMVLPQLVVMVEMVQRVVNLTVVGEVVEVLMELVEKVVCLVVRTMVQMEPHLQGVQEN